MKLRIASALIAGLLVSAAPSAMAQSTPGGTVVNGIAVANPPAVVGASNAYKTAQTQRPVTYKAQIDQANTRKAQIEAQLKPLITKLEADSKVANPNRTALQQQYEQIQQIQQAGQQEIEQILAPLNLSQQYVLEQIGDKLDDATQRAMTRKKVTVVLDSQGIIKADQVYNLNQDILAELNTLIPSAQLVPPAGWMPRAQREAQAQQGAQAPAAAPQTNTKQPSGR